MAKFHKEKRGWCQNKKVIPILICYRLLKIKPLLQCRMPNNAVCFIIISMACALGPSVTTSSTDFSFSKPGFWELFEFSAAEIT